MPDTPLQTTLADVPDARRLGWPDVTLPLLGSLSAFAAVAVVTMAVVLGSGEAGFIESFVARLQSAGQGYYLNMGVMVILYVPPLGVMLWIARRKKLEFFTPVAARVVTWAFGSGVLYAILFELLQDFLIRQGFVSYTPSPGELLLIPRNVQQLAVGLAVASLLGPLVEEFYFRGMLFTWCRERMRLAPAVLINAVLFGIVHFYFLQHPGVEGLFVTSAIALFGALNVWWTVRTGSLWPAFASHAAYNGMGLILMFLAPATV